ncbi:hypothetical protein ACJMK2_020168 [Sinanodonta woodiana]|uniref:procollagen-proline 3-dioxygenase n=1 Tax=Sinanodonta woodiana TaxID=1069815 RepID=A0ABD3TYF3_SINWO
MVYVRKITFSALFLICFSLLNCLPDDPSSTYEILYEKALEAYKDGNWFACASYLNRSIQDYKFYVEVVTRCRLNCKKSVIPAEAVGINFELIYYQQLLEISDCLRRCKKGKLGKRPEIPAPLVVDRKFEDRMPYNYLQFCYFKLEKNKEAVAAAYTYFITHQDDQRIIDNLKYYRGLEGVTDEDFKDLERNAYQNAYVRGLHAYHDSDWESTVKNMEESLRLYFEEEEKCCAACEGPYSHNGHPDFVNAVADHFLVVLICQYKCEEKLSVFGKEYLPNFVGEHFNFLQFAYFHMKDLDKVVQAVATFLLFQPDDEDMLRNKAYYMKEFGFHQGHFIPFEEAKQYFERRKIFSEIIDYVKTEYALSSDKLVDDTSNAWTKKIPPLKETTNPHSNYQPFMEYTEKIGVTIVADSAELNGSSRLAADGFFHDDHCHIISDLIRKKKSDSTGVRQITIPEAIQVVVEEHEYEISLRLLLRVIEVVRLYISAFINSTGLFVKQARIVCRPGDDKGEKKQHEDCIPQEDGGCIKTFSHLSDQEYIGVAFLTNIIDGTGQLYFMDKDKQIQSSLAPKCGRLTIFKASDHHGVNPSSVNERCSLYVHLTSNVNDDDKSQRQVKEFLKKMDEGRTKQPSEVNNTEILQQFYDQGVKIIQAGEKDLLGRERLVADGLATEEECSRLINLTRKGGLYGDGYKGTTSPHTDSETFLGLNISRASKLVQQKAVSMNIVQLALDISEMSRLLVEKFLNLSHPLYFEYTHLVCRTAKEANEKDRSDDLSHPVHADNCDLQPDGTCIVRETSFMQRHYSAILYLNEDIEGGDFFFAYPNKSVQVSVQPKCGRLVGFNAGEFHGVRAVLKGQRCALAMWYTKDPSYVELSRITAKRVLSQMGGKSKTTTVTDRNQNTGKDDEVEDASANVVHPKNADDQNSQSIPASKESKDAGAERTDNESEVSTSKETSSSMMEVKSKAMEKEEL